MAQSNKRGDQDYQSASKAPWLLSILAALVVVVGLGWFFFFRSSGGAEVVGKVTLDGEPVIGASVVFLGESSENAAPIPAQTDSAGEYRLIGNAGPRIPTGKYKVAVTKLALPNGIVPAGELLESARSSGKLVNVLPSVYEDRATTPLTFDVHAGSNTISLELKKKQ
jgi:hypothetical protein